MFQPQHAPFCEEYATCRRLNLLVRQQAQAGLTGAASQQLLFPMGKVSLAQQAQLLQSWEDYRRLRVPTVRDDDQWRCACVVDC